MSKCGNINLENLNPRFSQIASFIRYFYILLKFPLWGINKVYVRYLLYKERFDETLERYFKIFLYDVAKNLLWDFAIRARFKTFLFNFTDM